MNPYIPVLMLMGVGVVIGAALSGLATIAGPRKKKYAGKDDPIECGVPTVGGGDEKMSVHFYMTAILFILFDIETVFLYLWAITFNSLGWLALVEGFLFVAVLLVGYVYVWKRGALEWV